MSDVAIKVEHLGKRYRRGLHLEPYKTLRDTIASFARRERRSSESDDSWFSALEDVSFEIKHGETVGIVGRNGAGKSTLLKLLCRVTSPTTGRAVIHGRIGSLLEVGTGFHLELTGRENVKLNGAVLGLSRREITSRFDDIVEFAGVNDFIDTPVKRYSSGMFMRLAFSVAAHLDPDILIVDEVLAVGDAEFQKRCLGKLSEVGRQGRTVIFVSHNLAAVNQLCDRGLLLADGRLELDGQIGAVTDAYLTKFASVSAETSFKPTEDAAVYLTRLTTCSLDGQPTTRFGSHEPIILEAQFDVVERIHNVRLWAWLYAADGTWLIGSSDIETNPNPPQSREPGTYVSRFIVPPNVLNEGAYQFRFLISRRTAAMRTWDYYADQMGGFFDVEDTTDYTASDLGKRKALLLLPLKADEKRL
jgi:lipopolysaccharide transport system ATP-binding protein